MLRRARHDKAATSAEVANATQKRDHAITRNYLDYNLWGARKSNSKSEEELSWAYDARLFAIRKRKEARRRQGRDGKPLIKAA